MATGIKVSTQGMGATIEALVQMGRDIDLAIPDALLAGAVVLQDGMRNRAPKDTHNLEAHIQIDGPHQDGNLHFVDVGVIHKSEFTDADTARYANAQEYGTSSVTAKRYIRGTVDEDKGKASKAMRKRMAEELQR